ncbi:MAG: Transcriptional regulator [Solirubrobacterales bacterium]|nr:Transcriptional regulator [Solirubrobacterales bacterium]
MGHVKRTYGDACGIARALDLVGERWSLMVVRELLLGPKRFTDLRTGLPHVSADVLAQRLRELEHAGVLVRRTLPPPAPAKVYALTPWGLELQGPLLALGLWGAKAPSAPDGAGMSADSHLLSILTLFDPVLAGDLRATIALHLGELRYHATVADGRVQVGRGGAPGAPDATIATEPATLVDVLHDRRTLADALAAGDLRIDGDHDRAARFLKLAPLPATAA